MVSFHLLRLPLQLTRDDTQCLTVPHVRWFLYQLLLSVKYCHSARILHR